MKFNRILLLLIGAAVLTSSCVSKKTFDALQAEKDDLAMKFEKLEADFASTKESQQAEIASLKEANMSLTNDKNSLNSGLADAKKEFEAKLAEIQGSLNDKQRQMDQLRGEINSAFATVESAVSSSNARINNLENFLYLDFDNDVNFRSGSARVSADDKETLESIANMLNTNPTLALIIEGHTDSQTMNADAAYASNMELSFARANAVVKKLVKMGVNPAQLIPAGRGEYAPIADNESAEGRKQNRRTEAIVVPNIGTLYRVYKSGK